MSGGDVKKESAWEVYIIRTRDGSLYTGITTDLNRRIRQHSRGQGGARYFHFSGPASVVFREGHADRSSASRRESEIKRLKRADKLHIVQEYAAKYGVTRVSEFDSQAGENS